MKRHLLGLASLLLLAACKDQPEQIPAYLKIEPFTVNAVGGADWQKISNVWVYVGDQFLGGYPLPATVPVLASGDAQVTLFPGVRENGIKQTPALYPFLERYEAKVNLTETQTTTIQPSTRYVDNAVFPWSVDRGTFNSSSIVLENRDADSATAFVLTTDGAFDGRSVRMDVDQDHPLIQIATEQVEGLPTTGDRQVWLELHYRNDIPFELWLLGTQGSSGETGQPVFQFLPTENWNKIYINLTEFVVALQQEKYRLYFSVNLPINANGTYARTNGTVLFDNLRLIHF